MQGHLNFGCQSSKGLNEHNYDEEVHEEHSNVESYSQVNDENDSQNSNTSELVLFGDEQVPFGDEQVGFGEEDSIKSFYFNFQERIRLFYSSMKETKFNKNKTSKNKPKPIHNLLLYRLKLNYMLSSTTSQGILTTFNQIIADSNAAHLIPLPATMKTIVDKFRRHVIGPSSDKDCLFTLLNHKYTLPIDIYPNNQDTVNSYSYHIMQLISEVLENVEPNNFVCDPDIRYTTVDPKQRVYEEYTTGTHFEALTNAIREFSNNPNAVALALGVTLDETHVRSGKSSKNQTPVCIYFLNLIDYSFKMHHIGYDNKVLPYSKLHLHDILRANKCTTDHANKLLSMSERTLTLDYLYDVLKPILDYQAEGLKLRVGGDKENAFDIVAYPHLVMITGDTKELDFLAGTNWRKGTGPKCRLCTSDIKTSSNNIDNKFRDDDTMYTVSKEGGDYIRHCYTSTEKYNKKHNSMQLCDSQNIGLLGENKLIKLFEWQKSRGIHSFYRSLVPDYLHTTLKGIMEYTISWSIHCIYAVAKLDKKTYSRSSAILDDRIINFPCGHSVYPVREYYFRKGIRDFFNKSWYTKESKSTGFFRTGNIETWKLPSLLMQVMLSINQDIVPFDKKWSLDNININKNEKCRGQISRNWGVGKVLLKALSCSLDFHFCCKSIIMVESAIDSLRTIVKNLRCNLNMLWLLKFDLIQACKQKTGGSHSPASKGYTGIKMHLIEHYPYYKRTFGADPRPTDTELSEQHHKLSVKSSYELTNKHIGEEQFQMLINLKHYATVNYIYDGLDDCYKERCDRELEPAVTLSTSACKNYLYKAMNKKEDSPCINSLHMTAELLAQECDRIVGTLGPTSSFTRHWTAYREKEETLNYVNSLRRTHLVSKSTRHDFKMQVTSNDSSFVSVEYETDVDGTATLKEELCQIVAILQFSDNTDEKYYYIILAWLEQDSTGGEWPVYKYCLSNPTKRRPVWYDVAPIDAVTQPAFLVPYSIKKCHWLAVDRPKDIKTHRFTSIPFDRIHRDTCHDFVKFYRGKTTSTESQAFVDNFDDLPAMLQDHEIDTINNNINMYLQSDTEAEPEADIETENESEAESYIESVQSDEDEDL